MKDIVVERGSVNIEALDTDLRSALGSQFVGVSAGPFGLRVHLADGATAAQETQAQQIVVAHDPARLTPKQQAEIDRKAKLEQARANYGADETDLTAFNGQPALIQKLAQKIVWLEREVASLHGRG
ncbi:MAG: hypothetical protein JNJ61_11600 [Anaerolineae bacterium]|nr:hypothetical protein [Anaerolineae bacterium]